VSTIATTQGASHISPVNERVYHQSNLLGDWKGSFSNTHQAIELKVVSINGSTAQVEYTHNGRTERGTASVDQNFITFGNITIATRDGKKAALEFSFGTVKQDAILSKAPPLSRTRIRWLAAGPAPRPRRAHPSRYSRSTGGMPKSDIPSMGRAARVSATSSTMP